MFINFAVKKIATQVVTRERLFTARYA